MNHRRLEAVFEHLCRRAGAAGGGAPTDGQLLERFARGDQAAFELLVRRYAALVWGVCRRVLRHAQDAEDAFQATFLVLVRRAAALDRRGSVASWLYGVATRVGLRARADGRRRRGHERRAAALRPAARADDPAAGELREVLDEEVGRLPEKYRTAVVLCCLQGKTHEEAARQLHWPLGTVKCRVLRGRERLRRRLARRGLAPSAGALAFALTETATAAPPLLVQSTVTAALWFAAGQTAAAAGASAPAAALAEGVLKAMVTTKLRIAAALVLALGLVSGGAGVLARHAGTTPEPTAVPVQAADTTPAADPPRPDAKVEEPKPKARPELEALWADLGGDESKALRAALALAKEKDAVAFLKGRVKPVTFDPKRMGQLIADLDSEDFATREKAMEEIEYMGEYAVPHLQRVLDGKPPLEVRKRAEQLLERTKPGTRPAGWARAARAVAVLEHAGSADAKALLEALKGGKTKALPTQEAEAALDRLADKQAVSTAELVKDLGGNDEVRAFRAALALAATPKETVQFLKENDLKHLAPPQADPKAPPQADKQPNPTTTGRFQADPKVEAEAAKLIKLLSAEDFKVREDATAVLMKLGPAAIPALQKAAESPDPEARARAAKILRQLGATTTGTAAVQRTLARRATVLLEHIGTPEAKQLLAALEKAPTVARSGTTALSPDGRVQAVAKETGVELVDVPSGKLLAKMQFHKGGTLTVAYSPDGKLLASGGGEGMVAVWDAATGKMLRTFTNGNAGVTAVAFSPDGKTLTAEDGDKGVRAWDVATGKQLR